MRLLLVNANTTQAVTDIVVTEARFHASPGTDIVGATATFGAAIVAREAENVVAGHAALDCLKSHIGQIDAAILAISYDTALWAAQEAMPFPVLGMTACALHTATLLGRHFGLITFGAPSRGMYLDVVARESLTARMAGCETIALSSAAGILDTSAQEAAVIAAADRLLAAGAASVVIAGAAIAGMARRLQPLVPVRLLDGIACAVRQAELVVAMAAVQAHA